MGQTVAALWASRERWLIDSLKPTFRFMLWNLCDRIMEFGHMHATQHRIRRLQSVSIIRPVDAGSPWTWKGRTMSNSVLVRFYVAEEGIDAGFFVRCQDVYLTSQSLVGHEDLGELLPASASLDHRTEFVLETTVDDARRVRQIPDVNHISQRKVGQNGRVRITVDMPESVIPEATSHSCIWARSSLCATTGLLLYQSVEQWEELSSLLAKEAWISGRVLCESPRWVLVDTSTGRHSDDVISRLKEWRVAGLISQDISYRSWHVNKEGCINLSVGLIDSGAKAEIRNVDPRFTTGTCKASLSAIGIWVDSISIDEVFDSEGIASRTMSVNVSKNDIDRLLSISRSFTRNNEKMKVLFTRVDPTLHMLLHILLVVPSRLAAHLRQHLHHQ